MFCVYCGTKLPDETRFCFMCGKKVEPADNAENIVAANSGSIDEEEFSIEIQEDPTTSSSEKSPDITEFIAPALINGTKPASAESIHYAESPKKKSAGKRALLIAIVVIIAALAAAAAFGMSLDISPN